MLQKILDKVFVNKKFNRHKTSLTLQINVFEIPDRNIWKLFSKYELLFLDLANSSSDPSQILILQFTTLKASLPPLPSLSNFTIANWNTSLTQSLSCFSSVFLFYPTPFNQTSSQVLDKQAKCQAKPIKFFINLYADRNTLWVKHVKH